MWLAVDLLESDRGWDLLLGYDAEKSKHEIKPVRMLEATQYHLGCLKIWTGNTCLPGVRGLKMAVSLWTGECVRMVERSSVITDLR